MLPCKVKAQPEGKRALAHPHRPLHPNKVIIGHEFLCSPLGRHTVGPAVGLGLLAFQRALRRGRGYTGLN